MADIWTQPWFAPAVAIVIGLPLLLVVLTEVGAWLQRRGNPFAKPVYFLRNFVVPTGALLALLAFATDVKADFTWVRVSATVFGFLVILLLLSGVNVVLFGSAKQGTWRDRLPSIFIDLARLALIVIGLAVVFSLVWDADVAGLFTALGVTSIVIGLALQNAVGSVVSGLLLLFEQPFRMGDWLDTSDGKGRVIEVNWRAVHIETTEGTLIIPTASLAGGSFTNLSRGVTHVATIPVTFGADDAPHDVIAALMTVAADLPFADPARRPSVMISGPGSYVVEVPVHTPADEDDATSLFIAWLWYAAPRRGLHWAGGPSTPFDTVERMDDAATVVSRALRIPLDILEPHRAELALERYAAGECVQRLGDVPDGLRFVIDGQVALSAGRSAGDRIPVEGVDREGYVGQTALTREPVPAHATALTPVTIAFLPTSAVEAMVRQRPSLGTHIGAAIDARRAMVENALAGSSALEQRASAGN